jgi:hypothetical protein
VAVHEGGRLTGGLYSQRAGRDFGRRFITHVWETGDPRCDSETSSELLSSSRMTRQSLGASMPIRTLLPLILRIVTLTLSSIKID